MKVEVKGMQSHEVDWSKNPQLVVSDDGFVVLVHENQKLKWSNYTFVGTRLDKGRLSDYDTNWIKEEFKPFHGEITLKND